MPSDYELYSSWKLTYPEMSKGQVAPILASLFNLSEDSVRGRLSRATTPENIVKVSKILQEPKNVDRSVRRQLEVIEQSQQTWDKLQQTWEKQSKPVVGYFVSDLHRGAPFRDDYWELTLDILAQEPRVDVISVFNDWQDNEGWGRWDDPRPAREKIWSEDVDYCFKLEDYDYKSLVDLTGATLLGINGNHDLWIYSHWRNNSPQSAELHVANRMEEHLNNGVLQFDRMIYQNAIHMSKGLVWEHGTSAAKRVTSRARATLPKYMQNGRAKSVCVGHSHKPALMNGREIDYHGVWFANAGTYYRADSVSYSRTGASYGWGGGIIRCEFKPEEYRTNLSLIEFVDTDDGHVEATHNGSVIARM